MSLALYGEVEKLKERVRALELARGSDLIDLVRENKQLRERLDAIEESLGIAPADAADKKGKKRG
jgi:hypothetical protein